MSIESKKDNKDVDFKRDGVGTQDQPNLAEEKDFNYFSADLRGILSMEPSTNAWSQIIKLFYEASEADIENFELLEQYAEQHMEAWDDNFMHLPRSVGKKIEQGKEINQSDLAIMALSREADLLFIDENSDNLQLLEQLPFNNLKNLTLLAEEKTDNDALQRLAQQDFFADLKRISFDLRDADSQDYQDILGSLEKIEDLTFGSGALSAEAMQSLASNPGASELKRLHLDTGAADLDVEGYEALAQSPYLRRLEMLSFVETSLNDKGLKVLAESENLRNVSHLEVIASKVTGVGAQALAESPYAQNISELSFASSHLGYGGAITIIESKFLVNLTRVNLYKTGIGPPVLEAMSSSSNFKNVTELDLGSNGLTLDGVRSLQSSEYLQQLESLDLSSSHIYENQFEELADILATLGNLTKVDYVEISPNNYRGDLQELINVRRAASQEGEVS